MVSLANCYHFLGDFPMSDNDESRVNMSTSVRPTIKQAAQVMADHENNSVSRVVEKAIMEKAATHPAYADKSLPWDEDDA